MEAIAERFLRYVKINTQSNPAKKACPSTVGQLKLAGMLYNELVEMGLDEVTLDKNGYVTACLPANIATKAPIIGFIAHMDTSPDFTAEDVHPRIISPYSGGDIILDEANNIQLQVKEFPELQTLVGQDLIVTDGHTLLGADDKAGIAEIMEAIGHLARHPEIPHATIKIGFTPDEEIGRGADLFPIKQFAADFAYTLDGGPVGELEYENFNAAALKLSISGRNVHPGTAKDKMINALQVGIDFHNLLPDGDRPEKTAGYQGFYHLVAFSGSVEQASMEYIIRNHDRTRFEEMKSMIIREVKKINLSYGKEVIITELKDQYYNMRERIEPVMHIVELARKSMEDLKITPIIKPIRGGTDGSKLSYMGLPTPNLFAGGYNFHGRYEFIPIQSMILAKDLILQIIKRSLF